jgi:hypothetical protein
MSSTLHLRKRLMHIAAAEVGVMEAPKNSNTGKRIIEYQRATTLKGTGWPYCAGFVCWCIKKWLEDKEVRDALHLTAKEAEAWRPKTAAAFGFHDWAEKRGLLVMNDATANVLHKGDIMTLDVSHVCLVDNDWADEHGFWVSTIDGNTSPVSGNNEGGGVFRRVRHRSAARKFIRILP